MGSTFQKTPPPKKKKKKDIKIKEKKVGRLYDTCHYHILPSDQDQTAMNGWLIYRNKHDAQEVVGVWIFLFDLFVLLGLIINNKRKEEKRENHQKGPKGLFGNGINNASAFL